MQPNLDRHFLVTISEDINALFGLRFVQGFFGNGSDLRLTLFYVTPRPGGDPGVNVPFCEPDSQPGFGKHCRQPPPALAAARDWLLDMGFPADRIALKAAPARLGTVKDIAAEAEEGLYDAVVLGRRGLSWFDELFDDSVTHRLLWEAITFPLWVCRNPARHRRNVLLCVDGSDQALRVADHVGFILRDMPDHSVTVFHNRAQPIAGNRAIEEVMAAAGEVLRRNGMEDERVNFLVKSSKDPASLILKEARDGEYAAVAVGRSGGKPDTMANIFGSTSQTLLRRMEGSALWISK